MEKETASDTALDNEGTAAGAYGRMRADRDPFLVRARRMSEVTVPFLFRPVGENGATSEMVPWNTLGSYLVFTNLGPKLTDALFPAGIPPMLLTQSVKTKADLRAIWMRTSGSCSLRRSMPGWCRWARTLPNAWMRTGTVGTLRWPP